MIAAGPNARGSAGGKAAQAVGLEPFARGGDKELMCKY